MIFKWFLMCLRFSYHTFERVNSIENYNRDCLEYYYNQLYGDWT